MSEENRSLSRGSIRYVFLDRDGVINRKLPEGRYVTRWEQFELLPNVAEAIAALNRSGRRVIVVTNQRGIALGHMTHADVDAIHSGLVVALAREGASLDRIYYCPHDRNECSCRKPRTGMIEAAFRDFPDARPENSILIGDSWSDIECGRAAGMPKILVERKEEGNDDDGAGVARELADARVDSLPDAVRLILG